MPGTTTRTPVASYQIQHWLKFADGTYLQVTELKTADSERSASTYEPEYIDKQVQPKYNLGRTDEISFEVDAFGPDGAQKEFAAHEDDQDVAVEYVRTCAWDFANGKATPANALVAKHAGATLNMNPMSQSASSPATMSGTITISTEYDYGTFDPETATYTPSDGDDGEELEP